MVVTRNTIDETHYKLCEGIAAHAHRDQKRWGGEPYIIHPKAMAERCRDNWFLKCVAILHDVLEDCKEEYNAGILRELGVPQCVIDVVLILTRRPGEDYFEFVMRVIATSDSAFVKLLDLENNIKGTKPGSLRDKYLLTRYILLLKYPEFTAYFS